MCNAAADGAEVPHLHIRNLRSGFGQHRKCVLHHVGTSDVGMARHRADSQIVAVGADVGQLAARLAEIHHEAGHGDAELHHWQEALPPGDNLALTGPLLEESDCLRDGIGGGVVECSGNHDWSPFCASWMARHTRSGVSGIAMSRTLNGASASTTALTTAGGAPCRRSLSHAP